MMDEEKLTLEQRVLMRHEDIRTTLGYGGKSKAETMRGANAGVAEMLSVIMEETGLFILTRNEIRALIALAILAAVLYFVL